MILNSKEKLSGSLESHTVQKKKKKKSGMQSNIPDCSNLHKDLGK